jgi:hypothetical protein
MRFEKPSRVPGKAIKKSPLNIQARNRRLFSRSYVLIVERMDVVIISSDFPVQLQMSRI